MKKNIFLLPTDKASVLYKRNDLNTFHLGEFDICKPNDELRTNYYIYITSDEEIKVNDYITDGYKVWKWKDNSSLLGRKKVILTIDFDLIKENVQAIDDEFLEWLCKNPTCEFVEVIKQLLCEYCGQEHCDRCKGYDDVDWYEIIIPQEETKEVICHDKFDRVIQDGCYVDVQNAGVHKVYKKEDGQLYFKPYGKEDKVSNYFSNDLILTTIASKNIADLKKEVDDKKQETLEEAAERLYPTDPGVSIDSLNKLQLKYYLDNVGKKEAFIEGAKWQAERMYSDSIQFGTWLLSQDITSRGEGLYIDDKGNLLTVKDLFEQFKKR